MGRQVNFYMHPDDLVELQHEIERRGDVAIYASRSADRRPAELQSVVVSKYGEHDLAVFLARKGEPAPIVMKSVADHFWIAADESPVLEFRRSYFTGELLRGGRLWVATSSYVGGKLTTPEGDFLRWADAWLRYLRRQYVRFDSVYRIGHAAAWASAPGHELAAP